MKRVIIPEAPFCDIPFYLSVEEWVAQNLPAAEYFFAWQVDRSIICGRHQDIPAEVDLQAAASNGVEVWRRKSGGGAVLADRNNVMFSYITPAAGVEITFHRYTDMICRMLSGMGIDASPTGRNDIAVGKRKVAGNAFLRLPGRCIVHGTMLYDADFDLMAKVLTPSRAKKESKRVVSVQSRITTLREEGINVDIATFVDRALNFLAPASDAYQLTPEDIAEVLEIRKTYLSPLGPEENINDHSYCRKAYVDGLGFVNFSCDTDPNGRIANPRLSGDFFPISSITPLLENLNGIKLRHDEVANALKGVENYIAGANAGKLAQLITQHI